MSLPKVDRRLTAFATLKKRSPQSTWRPLLSAVPGLIPLRCFLSSGDSVPALSQQTAAKRQHLAGAGIRPGIHKSEGIGNDLTARVRKAGTHHLAPERNGGHQQSTNCHQKKPANLLAFVGFGPVMVC